MCDYRKADARLTSLSGVTGTRDQSRVQIEWSTKFCKLFFRVADKNRQIFAGKENCAMKNWTKAIESDHNQVKKAGTLF